MDANKTLYLGVARKDITPPLGSRLFGYNDHTLADGVHDRLHATAMYFISGEVKTILINVTVCEMQTALSDRIRAKVAEAIGITKEAVIFSATHTHTAPTVMTMFGWGDIDTEYVEAIFEPQILEAALEAAKEPVPVTMGVAAGTSLAGINRRELRMDNTIGLGQNPWGPFNPEMTVASFKNENGEVIANMIHYGAHATSAGLCTRISRDWPGVMTDRLEKISGGLTVFLQGAAGDVGPRLANGRTTSGTLDPDAAMECAMEHGSFAAQDAVRIFKSIRKYEAVDVAVCSREIKLPLQPRISEKEAEEGYAEYEGSTGGWKAYRLQYYKDVKNAYQTGKAERTHETFEQSVVRIGDFALVCFPYEMFSEISMRVSGASKVPYTVSVCYTNGAESYFATEAARCRGGYEVYAHECIGDQLRVPNADWYLVTETVKNLEQL